MSCSDVCNLAAPFGAMLGCPLDNTCPTDCTTALAQFPGCEDEYYLAIDCAVAAPISEWSCSASNELLFNGPSCAAELAAFNACI
jgi:hypothetical protein